MERDTESQSIGYSRVSIAKGILTRAAETVRQNLCNGKSVLINLKIDFT